MDTSNLPIRPVESLLLPDAEDLYLAIIDSLDPSIIPHTDGLTCTLAANALSVYAGIIQSLKNDPSTGQTVTDSQRLKGAVTVKRDARLKSLDEASKQVMIYMAALMITPASRAKMIMIANEEAKKKEDSAVPDKWKQFLEL